MQLAVNYKVEVVRGEIIKRIEDDWPLTATEWLRREYERQGRTYNELPEPGSAIRFAMDFNCP